MSIEIGAREWYVIYLKYLLNYSVTMETNISDLKCISFSTRANY